MSGKRTRRSPAIEPSSPPLKLILPTRSSNEDWNDCEFAYLEIDRDRAQKILQRLDLLHRTRGEDPELFEMQFEDGVIDFFHWPDSSDDESGELPEDFEDRLPSYSDEEPWTVLATDFTFPQRLIMPTECRYLVLCEYPAGNQLTQGIEWQCYPTHIDMVVTTSSLKRKLIERIARS